MARICIADDDPDIRHLVAYALIDEGHQVTTANDGTEAIELLQRELPDLLVLDVMMPGIDGFEVLRQMQNKDLRDRTRVLMLTAKNSERDWEQGYELGADRYMTKPFDPDELVAAVRELLAASRDELEERREEEYDRARLLSKLEELFGN